MELNVVDRPQVISERLIKQLQDHTEFLSEELRNKNNMINCLLEQLQKREDTIFFHKNQVYNLQQKLNDLHTTQSSSYKSIDNNDFVNKVRGNDNKSNKNRSSSGFYYNRSFNRSFNTEVSTDDAINPSSEPTNELVISRDKNMNNNNNSKIMENNIVESDVNTTGIIVDDTKRGKENQKKIKWGN